MIATGKFEEPPSSKTLYRALTKKNSALLPYPHQSILIIAAHPPPLQSQEKPFDYIHLPIIEPSREVKSLSLLEKRRAQQPPLEEDPPPKPLWKWLEQKKSQLPLITQRESHFASKKSPIPYCFPNANIIPISHFAVFPPTILFPVFFTDDFLPKSHPIHCLTPTPLAQQCFIEGQQVPHPQPSLAFTKTDYSPSNQVGFLLQGPSSLEKIPLDLL